MQNIFLFGLRHCDQRMIVVLVNYFQIWNKKEQIINSRVISSDVSPMYIDSYHDLLIRHRLYVAWTSGPVAEI